MSREMGPLEKEIAELLSETMGKTALGLEIRVQGVITPAALEAIEAFSSKQRAEIFLEALTGWAEAFCRIARRVDEIQAVLPDDGSH